MSSSDPDLPPNWRASTLGEEIALQYGKGLPAHARLPGSINVYGSNGVVGQHNAAAVKGPGIVVGRKGSVGEVAFSDSDFWPIDTTYYVENKRNHNWLFLYYLLSTAGLDALNSHSAVPGLNRESAYPIHCCIPPKPEQKKIAAVLWKVQRTIATQDRLIAATRDLKASAMQRLFTRGLRNEPLKDTEIGLIPRSWRFETLSNFAETTSGGTPNRSETKYYNGDILWVKSGELNDGYIEDTEEKITTEGLRHSSAKLFQPGTLLIAMYGATVGKTAILEVAAATNQAVCAIFTSPEKVDSEFLRYSLIYDRPELLSRRYGGAQPNISQTVIRNFTIRCPSLEEQRAIANALATIDRKLVHHRKKRAALNDLFQTLLHKLMTAELRVTHLDIDTREVAQPETREETT